MISSHQNAYVFSSVIEDYDINKRYEEQSNRLRQIIEEKLTIAQDQKFYTRIVSEEVNGFFDSTQKTSLTDNEKILISLKRQFNNIKFIYDENLTERITLQSGTVQALTPDGYSIRVQITSPLAALKIRIKIQHPLDSTKIVEIDIYLMEDTLSIFVVDDSEDTQFFTYSRADGETIKITIRISIYVTRILFPDLKKQVKETLETQRDRIINIRAAQRGEEPQTGPPKIQNSCRATQIIQETLETYGMREKITDMQPQSSFNGFQSGYNKNGDQVYFYFPQQTQSPNNFYYEVSPKTGSVIPHKFEYAWEGKTQKGEQIFATQDAQYILTTITQPEIREQVINIVQGHGIHINSAETPVPRRIMTIPSEKQVEVKKKDIAVKVKSALKRIEIEIEVTIVEQIQIEPNRYFLLIATSDGRERVVIYKGESKKFFEYEIYTKTEREFFLSPQIFKVRAKDQNLIHVDVNVEYVITDLRDNHREIIRSNLKVDEQTLPNPEFTSPITEELKAKSSKLEERMQVRANIQNTSITFRNKIMGVLDVSGSMTHILPRVREEVGRTVGDGQYLEFDGCYFQSTGNSMRQTVLKAISLLGYGDAVVVFADFQDQVNLLDQGTHLK